MEVWKSISYREDYEVSNFGNCRRKMKKGGYNYINGCINSCGYRYFQVWCCLEKKRTMIYHHQIVAKLFIGERPEGLVIDHIDRDRQNNNVSNLRYITSLENSHNSSIYRSDITETDPIKRKKKRERQYWKEYYQENKEKLNENRKKYRQS